MKKNAGSPKKRPRRRHQKKQLKSRKRSLQRRLARLAKIRQALAAIRSDSHSPVVEPEHEKPLPTLTRGKPLWDVTINSANAPYDFGGPRPQLPPKSPDRVTIRLPSRAIPFTVVDALYHQPAVLRLRSSTGVLVLLSAEPCDPLLEPPTQHPRFAPALWSPLLTIVMPGSPPTRLLEPPPKQPLPHDWPPLPRSQPPGRLVFRVVRLKERTLDVVMEHAGNKDQVPAGDEEEEDYRPYEPVFIKYLQEINEFSPPTKPFRKKTCFFGKSYRPDKKRFSRKSISSLKKQYSGLSDSCQPRRYATKTPRLSRAAGKTLLTKRVKLLVPEIKQHSELFTPVSAAELLIRQQSSLGSSPVEAPLKPGKSAGNTSSEEQVPANKEEDIVHYKFIFEEHFREIIKSNQTTQQFKKTIIVDSAVGEEQAPTNDDDDSVHHEVIFRKRLQENKVKFSLTTNSSDVNSDQLTPASPAVVPMRQEPSVEHSPAATTLKFVYPATIADQLPSAEWVFDKRATKLFFREHYGLTKTTSGKEWEFREAEKLFLAVCKNLPTIKQQYLDEFGGGAEEFFIALSTEIAQYELGLTRQDEIIREILQYFYDEMADFDRLLHSLTELQTANSSDTNSDPFTPDSPAAGPIRQESSAESSSAEKPLKSIYPAIIADQLPNAEREFPRGYAKYFFRKHYGLTKTTSEKEWEFREAEKLFIKIHKNLPKIKQRYLDEFGGAPEEFFSTLSTELAQYELGLTQQDEIIRDILHRFSKHMANFDQLVQSLAASSPTAPGALDSPANPLGTVTASPFVLYPKQDTLLNNND